MSFDTPPTCPRCASWRVEQWGIRLHICRACGKRWSVKPDRLNGYTALQLASDWWWDEKYFAVVAGGRAKWESCRMTAGGKRIRVMRLDNSKLRVFQTYIKPSTKMRLVKK